MKAFMIFLFSLLMTKNLLASHISGGELFYEYIGAGTNANSSKYKVTMRLFRECNSTGQELNTETVNIGIYNTAGLQLYTKLGLVLTGGINSISLTTSSIPCLVGSVNVCYQIGIFTGFVELPTTADGFTLSWIRFSRQFLENVQDFPYPENSVGATFTTQIPGTNQLPEGHNSSPEFVTKDTSLVCSGKKFTLDFNAIDKDNDSLVYRFCTAYNGGNDAVPNPEPPGFLSLIPIPYQPPYSGAAPLGPSVEIDSKTGIISGVAPSKPGKYVVKVCVEEWRNGKLLNTHSKDFIMQIGNCDFAAAELPVKILSCDGFTLNFENQSTSAGIEGYFWDFGVDYLQSDTSGLPTPQYTFPDTGVYKVTLTVFGKAGCVDSGSSMVYVYPGFKPDFKVTGSCVQTPYKFTDLTTSVYGTVNSWHWNFDDSSAGNDSSELQNPSYKYSNPGKRQVQLIVSNTKGCLDTLVKEVEISDKPQIIMPFRDTLICNIDSLQLTAGTAVNADFKWFPDYQINNTNIANPVVFPKKTTTYTVSVDDKHGCINTDSVTVNVIDKVTVNVGADTTICRSDAITFNVNSNALYFQWSPELNLNDPRAKNPTVIPQESSTYQVIASVGNCNATDQINIKVVPYPLANAGMDTAICSGTTARLNASATGAFFNWSPTNSLMYSNTLTPLAGPSYTTPYVLTVRDTLGCPKPVSDTVIVRVIPPVKAFAGNDTAIVANQPLQLNATGGSHYMWSPTTGMNNPAIPDPLILLGTSYDSIMYKVKVSTDEGCSASDSIRVVIFKTEPSIFIPTGFTPNGDGINDVLKPILAGIKKFDFLNVYNRWGQLIFSTTDPSKGWDGMLNGIPQPSGTYVFMAQAINYLDKKIINKGTVVLIR